MARPTMNFDGDQRPEEAKPPTMSRSKVQLATSYAPGVLMTWEGGKGICRTVPLSSETEVPRNTRKQIFESMKELVSNWKARVRAGVEHATDDFALDRVFFDARSGKVEIDPSKFDMTSPNRIGYVPYPLVYRCGTCGIVQEFDSVQDQARRKLPARCNKPTPHSSRWTQIDVVYVHWSGNLEPLSPFNYNYDAGKGDASKIKSCTCGHRQFQLKNEAPVFSEWKYVCDGCGRPRPLKMADREVLRQLQSAQDNGGRTFEWIEVNMLPVSYRANNAFYPQRTSFIEFDDDGVVDLMVEGRETDLLRRLASIHDIPFEEPTEAEIEAALAADPTGNGPDEWEEYQQCLLQAEKAQLNGRDDRARKWRQDALDLRNGWLERGLIGQGRLLSPAIIQNVHARKDWAPRYDPIRLTIQHDAFRRQHIDEALVSNAAVDVMKPDVTLTDVVNDPDALKRYQSDVGGLLDRIGVSQMVLIRGLPICDFSFGYTRVSPTPIYNREYNGQPHAMPVRLKAFDTLPNSQKHPVYVTQQKNEALYFKLDESRIRKWLALNQVTGLPDDDISLGRALLEGYEDFGPFMDEFKDREGGGIFPRTMGSYIYLLLHSLSHQMMHSLADTSGIDRDGIGEHIFPADLSFVIYRKGMTPDLGNVSAMWRNNALDFLRRGIDPRLLRCGSGSLCDSRGGACPACIMVSEVSCISSNVLLSRASLRGGAKPMWEPAGTPDLIGFFDPRLAE